MTLVELIKAIYKGIKNFIAEMKEVYKNRALKTIYASAAHNAESHKGSYYCILRYDGNTLTNYLIGERAKNNSPILYNYNREDYGSTKKIHNIIESVDAIHCLLQGLMDTLKIVDKPSEIRIVTSTVIDIKNELVSYRKKLKRLIKLAKTKSCTLIFESNPKDETIITIMETSYKLLTSAIKEKEITPDELEYLVADKEKELYDNINSIFQPLYRKFILLLWLIVRIVVIVIMSPYVFIITIIAVIADFARKKFKSENLGSDIEVDIDECLDEPAYKRYLNQTEDDSQVEVKNKESKKKESTLDKPSYLRVNINEHSKRHHDWIASNK